MLGLDRRDALVLVGLVVVAGFVRFSRLAEPHDLIFDEIYYAQDACSYLGWGAAVCGVAGEASRFHPPFGKWLIAAGIWLFGYDPFGWRSVAALAGTLTVGLSFLLARRLALTSTAALVAAGVMALDPLAIVSSRVAMLDIFTTCFGVAAVLFAVLERDAMIANRAGPGVVWRPWRAAAGLAAGCAVATKWSGGLALLAVLVLVLLWDAAAGRARGNSARKGLLRGLPSVALWLVALPGLVYVASYAGHLDGSLLALPWAEGAWFRALAHRQVEMLRFHAGLTDTHPYASPAWSWLLGKRAIVYFFTIDPFGRYREILAFANPLIWLPALLASLAAAVLAIRRRAAWAPEPVLAVTVAATYVAWLPLSAGRSFVFLYYVLPALPFLAIALGWAVGRARAPVRRGMAATLLGAAVAVVLIWQPLIYGTPLYYEAWRQRIVFSDCTAAERTEGRLMPRPDGGPPPPGWCWV